MFEYQTENDLMLHNQSEFKRGDLCTNQLLSINHEIYKHFDEGYEATGVFLGISKAFGKVWLNDFLLNLKNNVSGNLLKVVTNFLYQQMQRLVLNGQSKIISWWNISIFCGRLYDQINQRFKKTIGPK